MGCEVYKGVMMCGPGMGPHIKCAFCDQRGRAVISLCDWPVMKLVPKRTELAEVGDVWITQQAGRRGRIVEIVNLDSRRAATDDVFMERQFWVLIPGHPKPFPYWRINGATFTTEGPGTCDKACCFRHRRHVGIDKDYCADHWQSWAEVS